MPDDLDYPGFEESEHQGETDRTGDFHQRVAVDDARRCQAVGKNGQCRMIAVEGSDKCVAHGGFHKAKALKERALRELLAAEWRAGVGTLADSDDVKSLKTEIGILRLLLVKIMNSCKSDQDLLMRSGSISDLVVKVQKVVESCHRLDQAWGQLLDKTQLAVFGQTVIQLVAESLSMANIPNCEDILQMFARRLVEEIKKTGDPRQDSSNDLAQRGVLPAHN